MERVVVVAAETTTALTAKCRSPTKGEGRETEEGEEEREKREGFVRYILYTFIYVHIPLYTFMYFHIPPNAIIYSHVPSYTSKHPILGK